MRGRETERDATRALLDRAGRGAGGVLLVDGEPGIGKSLLLRGCARDAAARRFAVVTGTASRLERTLPFSTLRDAMPELFAPPRDGDAQGDGAAQGDGDTQGDGAAQRHDDAGLDAADATGRWTARVRRHLERRALAGPVLVCLDDLQWACPGTLAVVAALSRDLRRDRVAWLLARTSTCAGAAGRAFRSLRDGGASRVTLGPLGPEAVTGMLTDAFGAPPGDGLEDLAAGAAGNPSLLAELAGGLRAGRAVRVAQGRAVLSSGGLPDSVIDLARRRLEALSGRARHLVVTAAVLDPEFRFEDAAEMLGQTPAALLPVLAEAVEAGIMTAGEFTFAFRHPLLRRAVAETIPGPARRALHRQYGELLLTRAESAGQAASHLLRAARPGDGAAAGLDSAAARVASAVPEAAADLAVRALELTPLASPDTVPRRVAAAEALAAAGRLAEAGRIAREALARPVAAAAEARLRCVLSAAACAAGRPREAAELAERALAEPELPGGVRDQALTARLQALAGLRDPLAGRLAAEILAERGERGGARGEPGGPAVTTALAVRALADLDAGLAADGIGRLREAAIAAAREVAAPLDGRPPRPALLLAAALTDLRRHEEAGELLRAAADGMPGTAPARAALCVLRARTHLAAGRAGAAAAAAQAARDLAGDLGAAGLAAAACCVLAVAGLRRGDEEAAARHLAGRPVTSPQFADVYARSETALAAIQVREAREGPAAVLETIRALCAELEERPGPLLGDPAAAAWVARTALAGGDRELAVRVSDAAAALAKGGPEFAALTAAADHARGVVYGDRAALASAAARHPDPWGRASAAEDMAAASSLDGAKDEAAARLKDALAGYGQAGAGRDEARVRRRLRTLGVRHRHWAGPARGPVTGWNALTETEQAVARLVAEGLSNGQVAARMYISTHTVAHHLRQSYRKLAIASRVELTRVVLRQDGGPGDPAWTGQ